ncbi:MAG: HD-GYP domain-containing protein [Deltaproteobacteria bacterium]|nr:HD-GYP domain-containing protein [Deltaproteobacteria bacterium]
MDRTDNRDAILKSLNAAIKSRRLYPSAHPAIVAPVKKGHELITDSLKEKETIVIAVINEALVFEDGPVPDGERLYPDLVQNMTDKKIEAVVIERGISENELSASVEILSGKELAGPEVQKELQSRGISRFSVRSVSSKRNALEIYNNAVVVVQNVMNEIRMGKIPRGEAVNNIVNEITDKVLTDPNAIIGLAMIKSYDNYLYNHSVNVSVISIAIARAMDLSDTDLHAVGVGALLHDIGKTGVSEQIIRKPGGLSSEEWEKIKEHPLLGSRIIKSMEGIDETIGRLIYEHHVRYDHSGYPRTNSSLHPLSQIVTISDAYDALTTLRVYQQPHSPIEAIKIMSNFSGRHFNPAILQTFISAMGMYPIGTMVRLSTNQIGIVTRANREASERPALKILYDRDGEAVESPFELDLASNADITIVSAVNPAVTNVDLNEFFEKEAADAASHGAQ